MDARRHTLDTLQIGRAFAALCVVLFHVNAALALPKYLGRDVCAWFLPGQSGVDFFFVLSGFVIFLAHDKDIGNPRACVGFLWKRFRRLYPPLWVVLLVVLPVFYLVPSFGRGGETTPTTIVNAFLIAPAAKEYLLSVEWTLRHEIVFYLVFAVIVVRPVWGIALSGFWLFLSALDPWLELNFPSAFLFSGYHILFGYGLLAYLAYRSDRLPAPSLFLAAGAALFALAWYLVVRASGRGAGELAWLFGLGAALAIPGAATLERRRPFRMPSSLVLLGEASYSIYLVHFPTISLMAKLARFAQGRVPDAALFLAITATAIGVGIAFHIVVERCLLALFSWQPMTVRPRVEAMSRLPGDRAW